MEAREVLTRPARRPDAVLTYGSSREQLVDIHLPPRAFDSDARAPVVVLLHGGFWRQAFDRTHIRPLAEALSARGYVVMTPEFRRTGGEGGFPQTFDDVAAAVTVVPEIETVAPGRADVDDVVLMGHSAGGQLAMWVSLQPIVHNARRVVALAPVADLVEGYRRGLGDNAVEALMGGSPEQRAEAYATSSPAQLLPGPIPITVLHGDLDTRVPVEMSRELTGVEYVELAGVEHFGLIDPLSPAWPAVLAALKA